MVQFTPYKDPSNSPDYQRSSQGINVPSSTSTIGTVLTEGARLGSMAVQAFDEHNKQEVDKQLFQDINAIRTDSIHDGLRALEGETPVTRFDTVGGINAEGQRTNYAELPPGISSAERNMERMSNANLNKKLTDEAYYARMQETVQRVTTQYPGYARYAQDRAAHWLGTSAGANQQRAAIQQAIATMGAGRDRDADRDQRFLDSNMKYFLGPDGKFNSVMYNNAAGTIGSPAFAGTRAFIAEQLATEHAEDREDKRLSWLEKNNKLTEGDVRAHSHARANQIANKVFTEISFNVGGEERTYGQTLQLHNKVQADPEATPEARAEIGRVLGMYQGRIETDIRLWAMNTIRQGRPIAAWLGKDGLDQLVKTYSADLMGPIANDVGAGNLSGATRATTLLAAIKDNNALAGLAQKDIREFSMMGALPSAALGAVITHRLAMDGGVNTQERISTGLRDIGMKRMLIGDGNTSFKSLSERYGLAFPTTTGVPIAPAQVRQQADYIQKMVEDAKEMLTTDHPNMSEQGRVGAALVISHPENVRFIGDLNRDQQLRMYRNITTPEVTDKIFELGRGKPDLWNNYLTTAQQMFKRAYNTQLGNISQGAKDSFGNNIIFDEKNSRFIFEDVRRAQDVGRSRASPASPISATAQKAIDEVNTSLQSYRYILEKNNQKLDERELSLLGIVLKPQNPTSGSPNGSGRPSTKDKRSDLRDIESLGGEEAIPFSARETTGMNVGANELYLQRDAARQREVPLIEYLREQEDRMEKDSNLGGLKEQMNPEGIPKALERNIADIPHNPTTNILKDFMRSDGFEARIFNSLEEARKAIPKDHEGVTFEGSPGEFHLFNRPKKKQEPLTSDAGSLVQQAAMENFPGDMLNPRPGRPTDMGGGVAPTKKETKQSPWGEIVPISRYDTGYQGRRGHGGISTVLNPDPEKIAKLNKMLDEGKTYTQIAKEFNTTRGSVAGIVDRLGLQRGRPVAAEPVATPRGQPTTPSIPSQNRPMDQMTREEQNAARWLEQRYSAQNKGTVTPFRRGDNENIPIKENLYNKALGKQTNQTSRGASSRSFEEWERMAEREKIHTRLTNRPNAHQAAIEYSQRTGRDAVIVLPQGIRIIYRNGKRIESE